MKIKVFDDIKLPIKSHLPDSGLDLFIPESFTIEPLETKTIGLKLGFAIPEGYAGMLVPRSSIAEKGLIIQTSVIDPDYRGEIHLIITNCSKQTYTINKNDRVCSIIVYPVLNFRLEYIDEWNEITDRGNNGLGSTGK